MLIVSWNVNGLSGRFEEVGHLADRYSPDILCLQKVRCKAESRTRFAVEGYRQMFELEDCGDWSGVSTYLKVDSGIEFRRVCTPSLSRDGHLQAFDCGAFALLNTYVPYANQMLEGAVECRRRWDVDFRRFVKEISAEIPVVICGDMNVVHTEYDSCERRLESTRANFTKWERENFNRLLSECGLADPYRTLHPTERKPTYYGAWRNMQTGNRIDYFLVSRSVMPGVSSAEILTDFGTGQSVPISLEISMPCVERPER